MTKAITTATLALTLIVSAVAVSSGPADAGPRGFNSGGSNLSAGGLGGSR